MGHRLEHDRLLTQEIGHQPRSVMIVDAEHLQYAGIG